MTVKCQVFDYDTVISSDLLGAVEIPLDDLFKNPGTLILNYAKGNWINQVFKLKDEKGLEGKFGDVYLQLQWVPDA